MVTQRSTKTFYVPATSDSVELKIYYSRTEGLTFQINLRCNLYVQLICARTFAGPHSVAHAEIFDRASSHNDRNRYCERAWSRA